MKYSCFYVVDVDCERGEGKNLLLGLLSRRELLLMMVYKDSRRKGLHVTSEILVLHGGQRLRTNLPH